MSASFGAAVLRIGAGSQRVHDRAAFGAGSFRGRTRRRCRLRLRRVSGATGQRAVYVVIPHEYYGHRDVVTPPNGRAAHTNPSRYARRTPARPGSSLSAQLLPPPTLPLQSYSIGPVPPSCVGEVCPVSTFSSGTRRSSMRGSDMTPTGRSTSSIWERLMRARAAVLADCGRHLWHRQCELLIPRAKPTRRTGSRQSNRGRQVRATDPIASAVEPPSSWSFGVRVGAVLGGGSKRMCGRLRAVHRSRTSRGRRAPHHGRCREHAVRARRAVGATRPDRRHT